MGTEPGTGTAARASRAVTARSRGGTQSASRASAAPHRSAGARSGARWPRGDSAGLGDSPMPKCRWDVWVGTGERHPTRFVESTSPRDTCQAGAPFAALQPLQLRPDLLRDSSLATTTGTFLTDTNPCRAAATRHSVPSLLSVLPSKKQTHTDVAPSHLPALVHSSTKHISPPPIVHPQPLGHILLLPQPRAVQTLPQQRAHRVPSRQLSSVSSTKPSAAAPGAAHTGRLQPTGSCTGTVSR